MQYTYLGVSDDGYCSVLKSNYGFEELNEKAKNGSLSAGCFTSCRGTNWNGIDRLERTLRLIPFIRTGRVVRSKEPVCFNGSDQDMWHTTDWSVCYDTFCEMAPTGSAGADNGEPAAKVPAAGASRHVGEPGSIYVLPVRSIIPVTKWGRDTLYVITTTDGDVLTCKTDRYLEMGGPGLDTALAAVVKRHAAYRGIKETWVNDPRLIYIPSKR